MKREENKMRKQKAAPAVPGKPNLKPASGNYFDASVEHIDAGQAKTPSKPPRKRG